MCGELFKHFTNTSLVHIPYKGNGPALTDVLAGNVSVMFDQVASSAQHINSGRLTAFAVTSPQAPGLDCPTCRRCGELGYPQLEMSSWSAVMAPAGTPQRNRIDKLAKAVGEVLGEPAVKQRMERLGANASPSTAPELATLIQEESRRWKQVVASRRTSVRTEGVCPSRRCRL